ncbi:Gfo/Idh/MocA family oxidoreductase [Agarivorans sp. MS3-6]
MWLQQKPTRRDKPVVANDNKYQINSAAIIGCNWGLVHLGALRNSNIDVSAIVDLDLSKAQHLAKQHNIAHACNDVQQIPTVDLVIVASPAVTHQALIQHFQHCAIICEKPLLGLSPSTSDYAWPERLWVNYAFSHLASARLVDRIVAEQSQPVHITLSSQVNLPLKFTLEQWFLETSSHPLSWLLHRFGQPKQTRKTSDGQHLSLQLECANNRIDIDFTLGGELGIFHQIEIAFGAEKLSVEGEYISWPTLAILACHVK